MNNYEKMTLIMDRQLSTRVARGVARPGLAKRGAGENGASPARMDHGPGENSLSFRSAQSIDYVVVLGEN